VRLVCVWRPDAATQVCGVTRLHADTYSSIRTYAAVTQVCGVTRLHMCAYVRLLLYKCAHMYVCCYAATQVCGVTRLHMCVGCYMCVRIQLCLCPHAAVCLSRPHTAPGAQSLSLVA
jgi:hypothetical protein